MILPTKHISTKQSLIGIGFTILASFSTPVTLSQIWEQNKDKQGFINYERFILALDLLYILGAVDIRDGLIIRESQ